MSRRSTKQRRAARTRRWIGRHLFSLPFDGDRLFLPALAFLGGSVPFTPSRLRGLGWTRDRNHYGFIQAGGQS